MNERLRWPPPPLIGRRFHPSTAHFMPPASGGLSIRRIVDQLVHEEYAKLDQIDIWTSGDGTCLSTKNWPWRPHGQLYQVLLAEPLERWFEHMAVDLSQLRLIVTLRDPRDSIISQYHLTNEPVHVAITSGHPIAASYAAEAERVRQWTLEGYIAERFASQVDNLRAIRRVVDRLQPENVCFLSYAQLCERFPHFLQGLIEFLQIRPSPAVIATLLQTEDIRYKERLHRDSLSHCANAAPMPGRHKRELKPETISWMTQECSDILNWMAAHETPELASLYLGGVTP